jgi:uncharacterized protein (TIGR02996 family)
VEAAFLAALHAEPNDEATWLALADWLDEDGRADRAELVRLVRRLRVLPVMKRSRERAEMERRVAHLLNAGVRPVVPEVVNSIGMRLALIPPGRFRMGSPFEEHEGYNNDEGPLHEVEITRPFYLGVFPATQGQWLGVMGDNPSHFCATGGGKQEVAGMDTSDFPVEWVSWEEAQAFLENLAALPDEKGKGWEYRLPSEAEWEYACRGGASSSTPFCFGRSLASAQANFNGAYPYGGAEEGPSLGRTSPAGSYRPNAWGLFDLHGNVWEWCEDWYAEDYYGQSPAQDPLGPSHGSDRVVRGGSWNDYGRGCRAAYRLWLTPSFRGYGLGFRVAAVPRE